MLTNSYFRKLALILGSQIEPKYLYSENTSKVDNIEEWIFMSSPLPIAILLLSYLGFVLKIGPEVMKKRKPFNLKYVLVVYNIVQVIFSVFVFYIATDFLFDNGLIMQRQCVTENERLKIKTASIIHYYFLAKVSELLDTILFVVRKKDRQVSFLHVYHHTLTVVCSWSIVKFEPSYVLIFLGAINSFVHIIMYAYYGLSAFPHLTKYLWWKKYITKLQLVQFLLIVLHLILSHKLSPCDTSNILLGALMSNSLLFLYLFSIFYIKEYLNNNEENRAKKDNLITHNVDNSYSESLKVSDNYEGKITDKND